jgi:small GTP-binding protein
MKSGRNYNKLIIVGNTCIGKSTLLSRLKGLPYEKNQSLTIGVAFETYWTKNRRKLLIHDTSGQERFRSIAGIYYRNSDMVIIMFKIDENSIDKIVANIKMWKDEVMKNINSTDEVPIILIGNKFGDDDPGSNELKQKSLLLKEFNLPVYYVNTKTGFKIGETFEEIGNLLPKTLETTPPKKSIFDYTGYSKCCNN